MTPPRPTKAPTLDATARSDGSYDTEAYAVMEQRDSQLIQSELLYGAGSSKFVYQFAMGGKTVSGISVIGARHLAAHYGGIKHQLIGSIQKIGSLFTFTAYPQPGIPMSMQVQVLPDLRGEPDFYGAVVQVTDTKSGNVIQVEKREERFEFRRDGTPYERPHYALIAQSKAYRNAVLDLLPQDVQIEWCAQMVALGNSVPITESVIDLKRDAVLKFATARGLQINRLGLDRLTMNQISGLGDAAREGAAAFVKAATMAGVMRSTDSFVMTAGPALSESTEKVAEPTVGEKVKVAETKREPAPTPTPTPAPAQEPAFYAYMADHVGEMVMRGADAAIFTDHMAFANALAELATAPGVSLETLAENNDEAMRLVQAAGGPAWDVLLAAFKLGDAKDAAPDAEPPQPIGVPMKGERQDIVGYLKLVSAAMEALDNADDINGWIAVNHTIIGGLGGVGRRQAQKVIDDRRRALGLLAAEAAPAAPVEEVELKVDLDANWARGVIAEMQAIPTWAQVLAWTDRMDIKTRMGRFKRERPDLFKLVDDALIARKPPEAG